MKYGILLYYLFQTIFGKKPFLAETSLGNKRNIYYYFPFFGNKYKVLRVTLSFDNNMLFCFLTEKHDCKKCHLTNEMTQKISKVENKLNYRFTLPLCLAWILSKFSARYFEFSNCFWLNSDDIELYGASKEFTFWQLMTEPKKTSVGDNFIKDFFECFEEIIEILSKKLDKISSSKVKNMEERIKDKWTNKILSSLIKIKNEPVVPLIYNEREIILIHKFEYDEINNKSFIWLENLLVQLKPFGYTKVNFTYTQFLKNHKNYPRVYCFLICKPKE
jgi:hypothetical protein